MQQFRTTKDHQAIQFTPIISNKYVGTICIVFYVSECYSKSQIYRGGIGLLCLMQDASQNKTSDTYPFVQIHTAKYTRIFVIS